MTQETQHTEHEIAAKLFEIIELLDANDKQEGVECNRCGTRFSYQMLCPHCGKPHQWELDEYHTHQQLFYWFAKHINGIRDAIDTAAAPLPARGNAEGTGERFQVKPVADGYVIRDTEATVLVYFSEHEAKANEEAARLNAATGSAATGAVSDEGEGAS